MSNYKSFANLNYDACAIKKKDDENKDYFGWITDPTISESKDSCFNKLSPFSRNPSSSIPSSKMDIESDLRGQTQILSRCSSHKFTPKFNVKTPGEDIVECANNTFLEPEYTRVKKPCNTLSGISINRFEILHEDYQSHISDNSFIGVNTRLEVRDTFAKTNNRKI